MAGQLMLVNPRSRRRVKRNPKRRKLTPEQKAANAAKRSRRSAAKKGRRAAVKKVRSYFGRARRTTAKVARRSYKAARKSLRGGRRSRRKPQSVRALITNPGGFARRTVLPAAIGAAGALAFDVAYAYLPIPANLKSGALAPVIKIGAVGLIGAAVSHFAPQKQLGVIHASVTAAITVIAYGWLKGRLQAAAPQLRLGELVDDDECLAFHQSGVFIPGAQDLSEYISGDDDSGGEGVSEYISDALDYTDSYDGYADMVS